MLTSLFTDIADAIRAKTGSTDAIVASQFPEAIAGIESGVSVETCTVTITPTTSGELYYTNAKGEIETTEFTAEEQFSIVCAKNTIAAVGNLLGLVDSGVPGRDGGVVLIDVSYASAFYVTGDGAIWDDD